MTVTDTWLNIAGTIVVWALPWIFVVLVVIPAALPRRLRGRTKEVSPKGWNG